MSHIFRERAGTAQIPEEAPGNPPGEPERDLSHQTTEPACPPRCRPTHWAEPAGGACGSGCSRLPPTSRPCPNPQGTESILKMHIAAFSLDDSNQPEKETERLVPNTDSVEPLRPITIYDCPVGCTSRPSKQSTRTLPKLLPTDSPEQTVHEVGTRGN